MSTRLSDPIQQCSDSIKTLVETLVNDDLGLLNITPFTKFEGSDILNLLDSKIEHLDYNIITDPNEADQFNKQWKSRTKEFILNNSFQSVMQTYLEGIVDLVKQDLSDVIHIHNHLLPITLKPLYNKISIILDYSIQCGINNKEYKKVFYQLVAKCSEVLFDISTEQLLLFWYYMESRTELIKTHLFDDKTVGDRISILEICNPIIDKFYNHYDSHKSSTLKDTFNDEIHCRVTIFVNKLFQLEDNTGLNKFFIVSKNEIPAIIPRKSEKFITDVFYLLKIIRDPFSFMKNETPRQSKEFSIVVGKVFDKLLKDELQYISENPPMEKFKIDKPLLKAEVEYLTEKYNNKKYFPELYFPSSFNKDQSVMEKEKALDQNFLYDMFDDHKFRETFLLQLFILSCTIVELSVKSRGLFMSTMPASTKHISDETPSDQTFRALYRIKREFITQLRHKETQLGYLLTNIASTEIYWWKWLIHGKDSDNKPLLANKVVTEEDLNQVTEKLTNYRPQKVTKYFNNYVTPQLSRRMKGSKGLNNIRLFESTGLMDIDADTNIQLWKKIRRTRFDHWLKFGEQVNDQLINRVNK